jgi:DNA repair protein SbcC/Rad50
VRILELSLRNYRVFEEVDLELPARVIGVFGPNGAGKSTLMEAIGVGLYGLEFSRTPKQQIRSQWAGPLAECRVVLTFEHAGAQYRVLRQIKGKNHAADAELSLRESVLADGVTEVDAEIRRLLHMDRQVFRSSVFAEQKQLDAFSDLTKAKRKEMVLRLLGIKPVDDARAAARGDARMRKGDAARLLENLPDVAALEAERDRLAGDAEAAELEATAAAAALAEASGRAEAAEAAFTAADAVRARAEQVAALREATASELERVLKRASDLQARLEETSRRMEDLAELRTEREALGDAAATLQAARDLARESAALATLEAELEGLPRIDGAAALAEHEAAEREHTEAQRASAEAAARHAVAREALDAAGRSLETAGQLDPSEPCPTCRQPLGDAFEDFVEHRRQDVARLEREAAGSEKAAATATALQTRTEKRWTAARKAAEAAGAVEVRRGELAATVASARARVAGLAVPFGDAPPLLAELEAGADRAKELDGLLARLDADAEQLERLQGDIEEGAREADECRTRLEGLDAEAGELAFDAEEHNRVTKERDEARALLEQARASEREAAGVARDAAARVATAEAQLTQARELAERAGAIRDEAHYLERVGILLDGFRDHLVTRIGPELSREAEALFRELTNHEYEDLKIADDDLSIQIADDGAYFDMERFSGSETDLANLALRVAISVHLSRMSGADVGMMVLDEVLGSLDAERKDLMVQAMGRLADRFQQLFVVTHAEQIKDQFPASIEVRKAGRRRSQAALV